MKTKTTLLVSSLLITGLASAAQLRVTITNNAPTGGVAITPVWVGFHDGSFDSYDGGQAAQPGLQQIAETGASTMLDNQFQAGYTYVSGGVDSLTLTGQTTGRVSGSIAAATAPPPLQPGQSNSAIFDVTAGGANNYFSYVSMVLPSSDYYVANGNPTAWDLSSIIDSGGSISFNIGELGGVTDAGTEVNDFASSPGNPLFGIPDGTSPRADENGVNTNVTSNPYGSFLNNPGGLSPNLDFTNTSLYTNGIATITIERVPEPSTLLLSALSALGLVARRRR